jgi:hypothetical protein
MLSYITIQVFLVALPLACLLAGTLAILQGKNNSSTASFCSSSLKTCKKGYVENIKQKLLCENSYITETVEALATGLWYYCTCFFSRWSDRWPANWLYKIKKKI